MLSKLKSKCKKLALLLKPKLSLKTNTIVINKNTWQNFDASIFNSDFYNYIEITDFRQIKKSDYDKIHAIVGGISDRKYLKQLKNLSWFQLASHGHNGYENKSLYTPSSPTVTNLSNVFSKPMAEYAITAYHLFHCYAFRKKLNPQTTPSNVPSMKKDIIVMIYGLGNIGKEIAIQCKKQGWKVFGVRRQLFECPDFVDGIYDFESSKSQLSKVDYIINVLPETIETSGIFNKEFFKLLKKNCIFTNLGRASAVVDEDLELAVKTGCIGGAILDASSNYKFNHPNIIKTGHTSSVSTGTRELFNEFFTEQLKSFICNGTQYLENKIPIE